MKPRIDRKALSNRTRFEVFKRDKFQCQYCGAKAPDVVLNCDHIKAVAEGGTDDLMNLVTSCWTCNSGKADKALDDATAVMKARDQAESMEERKQQVEMMADWQINLATLVPEMAAIDALLTKICGRTLTDAGKQTARKHIRKHGLTDVMQAIVVAFDQYNADDAWPKVEKVLRYQKINREDPELGAVIRAYNSIVRPLPFSPPNYGHGLAIIKAWQKCGLNAIIMLRDAESYCLSWDDFLDRLAEIDRKVGR